MTFLFYIAFFYGLDRLIGYLLADDPEEENWQA
jgi:hypothetical protein